MPSPKRALTALATGALALPFLSVPAAYAVAPEPPAQQPVADFCSTLPASFDPFRDDEPNTFTPEIECIAFAGIAQGGPRGLPADQYGPAFTVQRDQMASFIARTIDAADALDNDDNIQALPGYDGSNAFSDVPADNTHLQNINRLEAVGIVEGGPGGTPATTYGPGLAVTRAQMASFINRAVDYMIGTPFETVNDYFTDDEAFRAHEANINGIASEGIAVGDGQDVYRPGQPVQRDQMAGFLARTLAVLHEDGLIDEVVEDAANTPATNEVIEVTAQGTAGDRTLGGVRANPDDSSADDRSFTVSGLTAGEQYRITLVTCASTTRNSDGELVFADADDDDLADTGMPTADITRVNGAAPTNNTGEGTDDTTTPVTNSAVATVPSSGTITFTIDGDAAECVVPVVYENGFAGNTGSEGGGTSPRLELAEDNTPAEDFGVGPRTTFATSNEALTVSPAGATGDRTLGGVTANPDTSTTDDRSFTVAGLTAGEEYRITLVTCASITRNSAGDAVFADADNDDLADTGMPAADITRVNGAAPTNNTGEGTANSTAPVTNSAVATVPANGTITFTIDGDTAECVVPVVYENGFAGNTGSEGGGTNPRLELRADNTPAEAFGVGPRTTFTAGNETLTVTPQGTTGDQTLSGVTANPDSTTADNRSFTVAGLTAGEEYRITLVTCASTTRNSAGQAVFADADNDDLADTGMPTADITQVNGAAPTNNTGEGTANSTTPVTNSAVATAPSSGTITFTIDGDTAECVIPVVYENGFAGNTGSEGGGTNPRLELNADNTPAETFGVGPRTTFTA